MRDAVGNELAEGDFVKYWHMSNVQGRIIELVPPKIKVLREGFGMRRRPAEMVCETDYPNRFIKLEPEELI